jgi:hypothetical protein
VELIGGLNAALDLDSPIFSFSREPNQAAHTRALLLHAEVFFFSLLHYSRT